MALSVLSLTEAQTMAALRSFLLGVLPSGVEVIKGQINRVPEPKGSDFTIMWPILQSRLATNRTGFRDVVLTGSIAGTVLTVSEVVQGLITDGVTLIDDIYPVMNVAVGTYVVGQLTGAPGGIGTYTVSPTQTLASETLYAGSRDDFEATEITVQLDVHGPRSGDNTKVIETLFRSEYATSAFEATGFAVEPLYADDARQMPFMNAEQQYEYRWTIDLHLQVNPTVSTPQQFATEVVVDTVLVDTIGVRVTGDGDTRITSGGDIRVTG